MNISPRLTEGLLPDCFPIESSGMGEGDPDEDSSRGVLDAEVELEMLSSMPKNKSNLIYMSLLSLKQEFTTILHKYTFQSSILKEWIYFTIIIDSLGTLIGKYMLNDLNSL